MGTKDIIEVAGFFMACLFFTSMAMLGMALAISMIADVVKYIIKHRKEKQVFRK